MRRLIAAIGILLSACSLSPERGSVDLGAVARVYFDVYAQRADFDRFMRFYADDAVLKDIIYGHEVAGKDAIRGFFDWGRGEFSVSSPGPILDVQAQLVAGNSVTTRGIFRAFEYNGVRMGPWEFLIWQEFNETGQVVRQEDWINYTPKQILVGG